MLARLSLTLMLSLSACPMVLADNSPVPIIFDTDIGNDCDDVLALGVIHALQSRGECDLLAVTITKDHELAAPFTDAVNTFYGRGEIPIGVCRSGVTPDKGKYNELCKVMDGSEFRFPHKVLSGNHAPDAVKVLRQVLANSPGGVVIAQVGFSTNVANLLLSKPDEFSSLNGIDLVKQKVKMLSIMAGAFRPIPQDGKMVEHREYNVVMDIPAAKSLVDQCPVPIVWSGFEIGLALPYPHQSILKDFRYTKHHPLAESYTLYEPPPHDRPTWDLTSVLFAVRPEHGYFDLSPAGRVQISDEGLTAHTKTGDRDRYLILKDEQKAKVIEALTLLASEPPHR